MKNQLSQITNKLELIKKLEECNFIIHDIESSFQEIKRYYEGQRIIEILKDIKESNEGVLFSTSSNQYTEFEGYVWLYSENQPEDIVTLHDGEFSHIDDAIFGYVGKYEEYFSSNEDYSEYKGEFYLDSCLQYHHLYRCNDGEIRYSDSCAYCEETGEYHDIDDLYYWGSDDCYHLEAESDEGLKDYHNSNYENLTTQETKFSIGFEIEKEDEHIRNGGFEHIRNFGYDAERDGSLDSDSGFEIVSPIFDLEKLEQIKESLNSVKRFINAEYSKNCGGHINLKEYGKTNEQLFNKFKPFLPLIYSLYYGRINNSYCKAKNSEQLNEDSERYQAFNFKSNQILEIRIFSAVNNVETLLNRIELIRFILLDSKFKGISSVLLSAISDGSKLGKIIAKMYGGNEGKIKAFRERLIQYSDKFANFGNTPIKSIEKALKQINKK